MSLQVWLPLIKDYKNQGLSNLTFANFRYIRFVINAKRGSTDHYTQLSRIEFIDQSDNLYEYPSETVVTTSMTGYPANETPSNLIDGNVNTKLCSPWSAGAYITIDLGAANRIDLNTYSRFQWYTANDGDWRDPTSFTLQFSNDGSNFINGAIISNASITTARLTLAYTGNCIDLLSTAGKVGAAAYNSTDFFSRGLVSDQKINLGSQLTMCCWMKFSSLTPDSALGGAMGGQHRYPTNEGMGLTIKYISSTTGYLSCNTGNGSSRTYNTYCGNTLLQANTWYHVGFTYNGNTIKFYVNGAFDGSHSYSGQRNILDYVQVGAWSFGSNSGPDIYGSYKLNGCINDFRIYDHVLSLKEIKTISQGLVAHYQLKGMGSTNYLKGSGKYTASNPLIRNANDSSIMRDSYIYYDTSDLAIVIPTAGKYTFVMESDGEPSDHKTTGTTASERRVLIFIQNTSTSAHTQWAESKVYGRGVGGELYGTFSNLAAGTYRVRTNLYAADNINYTAKFWNMKVVQGDYDPSDTWCPHNEDKLYTNLGLGNEPDCSGFGNDATKSNISAIIAGSPRYGSCYQFSGSQYLACGRGSMVTDALTVSCWVYSDNWANTGRIMSCAEGGGWDFWPNGSGQMTMEVRRNGAYITGVYPTALSSWSKGWHHIVGTYDGYKAEIYVDGVKGTTSATTTTKYPIQYHGSNGLFIGAEAGANTTAPAGVYFTGKISDVRIYGTALSAADVLDLYRNAASIAKNGEFFAYDFHENTRNTVDKNGIVASSGFHNKVAPVSDMQLTTLEDDSTWARIHYLDVTKDQQYFANAAEVAKCINKHNRYSRMGDVDKFKAGSEYEFMLTYPTIKKTLPAGYTELDYIEATGIQWINTGVTGHARWEFDIQFTNTTKRQLMGYWGSQDEYWGCQTDGKYGLFAGSTIGTAGGRDTIVHDFQQGAATLWTQNQTLNIGGNATLGSNQYQLFNIMGKGSGYTCHAKLWRCKCIQNNILIRDFIPAQRNNDNIVGLYDIMNNIFYINSGDGNFIPGYKNKLQKLEYIESTGTQYIDTGIAAPNGFKFDIGWTYTAVEGSYIIGSHNEAAPYGRNGVGSIPASKWELGTGDTCPSSTNSITTGTKCILIGSTVQGNSYLDVNGTREITTTDSSSRSPYKLLAFYNQYSLYHNYGTARGRLHYMKLYDKDGVLIRDFEPCVYNGKVGLYDKVESIFYSNMGTGNFIAGPALDPIPLYNRWAQTSSPNATAATGFRPISTSWPDHGFGIRKHGSDCLYNCDSGGTWYAPIGQYKIWSGGIPAADGTMQKATELWIRTDKLPNATQAQIYNGSIVAADYQEI